MAIRTKPTAAFEELNALDNVYDELVSVFNITNGIILGDMNADCRYLSQKKYQQLDLVKDTRFTWLINSTEDTTTTTSDCSYDRYNNICMVDRYSHYCLSVRIIMAGDLLNVVTKNGVFKFDEEYGLELPEAKDVSDHYPVEVSIKGWLILPH